MLCAAHEWRQSSTLLDVPVRPWSGFSSIADLPTTSPRRTESLTSGRPSRPGIPALDLWWLKSRALLAKAEGDSDGYAKLAKQYLSAVREARRPRATRRSASNGQRIG